MGVKDIKTKEFLSDNKRFADAFNYYLFDGHQGIRPEDLEERDTTEILSLYGMDKKEIQKQKWRDLLKRTVIKCSEHAVFVLLGIENQSEIHYAMPVKNMIYDAMNYGAQVTEAAGKHRKKKEYQSGKEFLSGFSKEDKLTPIITLTIYWGGDNWDAPRCLHDMFDVRDADYMKFVDDYHLHMIIPQEITDFEKFQTSIGEVLEIMKVSNSQTEMENVLKKNPAFKHLENEAVSTINVLTGLNVPANKKEGETNMCKAWQDQREEGIRTGKEEGRLDTIITFLMNGGTEEMAQKLLNASKEELEMAKNRMNMKNEEK